MPDSHHLGSSIKYTPLDGGTPVNGYASRNGTAYTRPPPFRCWFGCSGRDAAWTSVTGELDIATAPTLDETLQQAQLQARLVVLDLRELEFMDSAGAHTIVSASLRARLNGGRLVVVRGRPHIHRVFVLTRSCDVVDILDLDPSEPLVQALLKIKTRN